MKIPNAKAIPRRKTFNLSEVIHESLKILILASGTIANSTEYANTITKTTIKGTFV